MNGISARKNVRRYSDGANWSENEVALRFMPWIIYMVERMGRHIPSHLYGQLRQDMQQEASLALLLSWRQYQSRKVEYPFLSYCWKRIKGAIIDTFRDRRPEAVFKVEFVHFDDVEYDIEGHYTEDYGNKIDLYTLASRLDQWERNFLTLRYFEGYDLKYIGSLAGVTESRACQIQGDIISRMQSHP